MPDPAFPHTRTIGEVPYDAVLRRLFGSRYLVLAGAFIGGALGIVAAVAAERLYAATTTLLVRQSSAPSPTVATSNMRALIANYNVAAAVIGELSLPTTPQRFLDQDLTIEDVPGTFLMRVSVRQRDPALAARVANRVAQEAIELNQTLTRTGDDKIQRVMQQELTDARKRMNEAEARLTEFRGRQRAGAPTPLHVAEVEGARLHAEYDLATRLYEEIAVQYGKLRLQVAQEAAELIVIEEAYPADQPLSVGAGSRAVLGAVSGASVAFLLAVLLAVFRPLPASHH